MLSVVNTALFPDGLIKTCSPQTPEIAWKPTNQIRVGQFSRCALHQMVSEGLWVSAYNCPLPSLLVPSATVERIQMGHMEEGQWKTCDGDQKVRGHEEMQKVLSCQCESLMNSGVQSVGHSRGFDTFWQTMEKKSTF